MSVPFVSPQKSVLHYARPRRPSENTTAYSEADGMKEVSRRAKIEKEATGVLIDAGGGITGALVGLVVGGPPGALAGAAVGSLTSRAAQAIEQAAKRRQARTAQALMSAMMATHHTDEDLIEILEAADETADMLIGLIHSAMLADETLAETYGELMKGLLSSESSIDRERIMILTDSLRGLRTTHVRILKHLQSQDGASSAGELAAALGIPEVELRGVVRSLEARGMIKDTKVRPVVWELRELGKAVAQHVIRR